MRRNIHVDCSVVVKALREIASAGILSRCFLRLLYLLHLLLMEIRKNSKLDKTLCYSVRWSAGNCRGIRTDGTTKVSTRFMHHTGFRLTIHDLRAQSVRLDLRAQIEMNSFVLQPFHFPRHEANSDFLRKFSTQRSSPQNFVTLCCDACE